MAIREPRLRTLLAQAERNATYGKNAAAETIYRQILSEAPDAEEAWLGLAEVLNAPDEKRAAYERALELAPDMPAAVAGLARLDGRPVPPEIEAALAPMEEAENIAELKEAEREIAAEEIFPEPLPLATTSGDLKSAPPEDDEATYELVCYRHPDRRTGLRCYNCGRPICVNCANKTPVGYICPECQREAEDTFFNSRPLDYLVAALVSLPISLLAGFLMVRFFSGGFLFFIIIFLVSGAIGGFIGRVTKRAVGRRRGRYLPHVVVAMMVLGVVIPALPYLLVALGGNIGVLLRLLGPGIYLFVAASAAFWQMR